MVTRASSGDHGRGGRWPLAPRRGHRGGGGGKRCPGGRRPHLVRVGALGAAEEDGGGRISSRSSAASGGPAGTGEHDLLDSGPPRKRASGEEKEDDAEHLVVASAWHGVVGGEGEVRRPADGQWSSGRLGLGSRGGGECRGRERRRGESTAPGGLLVDATTEGGLAARRRTVAWRQ